jgi:hypothetical protein
MRVQGVRDAAFRIGLLSPTVAGGGGMSHQARAGEAGGAKGSSPARAHLETLDVIACDRCGRHFATTDGPGMIAAIKGPCPDCGGRFELSPPSSGDGPF